LNKRKLGKTGFQVTEISLGAWQIGGLRYGRVSEVDAHGTIHAYIQEGGNFIDTARGYNESERILGEYFQQNGGRERVFIASKSSANDLARLTKELETSLQLLQTDYLDLYYLHSPPDDPDEMNRALDIYDRFKTQGKIKSIGASIKGPNVTQKTVDLCHRYIQSGRVDALMIIYSIFRQKNDEILDEAQAQNVGIIPRTVLESGFLSGKYAPSFAFTGKDHRVRWSGERLAKILGQTQDLAAWAVQRPYQSIAQVALRFVLDQEGVSSVVVGARTAAQISEIIGVTELPPLDSMLRERLVAEFAGKDENFNTGTLVESR
jgi:aryl-alcohol dehydrogenase-like predicted oxidoreductase